MKYDRKIHQKLSSIENILDDPDKIEEVKERTDISLAIDYSESAHEYARNYGKFTGLSLGYDGINKRTGSFLPGEVFVIAGGTGFGKSVLSQNIAVNVALQKKMVLMITLEMTKEQTLSRMYRMTDKHDLIDTMIAFQKASSVNDKDIAILMRKASEYGMDLVILDHLHFLPRGADNIRNEISRITKLFKEASVEYKIPVIILCHVNRAIEKGQKPDLMHLKESSSIEQDADMVGFVYRDNAKAKDVMQFYMRKNRSRELIYEPMEFMQEGWKLNEIKEIE